MSHINSALKFSLGQKVGESRTMIHMEMCHEDQVHILGVYNVKVRQRLHSFFTRMNAAVHQHLATLALNVDAGTTDLIPRAKGCDLKEVTTRCLNLMRLYGLVELLSQCLNVHYYLIINNIIIMVLKILLLSLALTLFNSV